MLLISYFLPWVQFVNLKFTGYELPTIISNASDLNESFGNQDGITDSIWYSLIHIVPVGAILLIVNTFINIDRVDRVVAIILTVVLIGINFSIFNNGIDTSILGAGYMLSAIGMIGIIYVSIRNLNFEYEKVDKQEQSEFKGFIDLITILTFTNIFEHFQCFGPCFVKEFSIF